MASDCDRRSYQCKIREWKTDFAAFCRFSGPMIEETALLTAADRENAIQTVYDSAVELLAKAGRYPDDSAEALVAALNDFFADRPA